MKSPLFPKFNIECNVSSACVCSIQRKIKDNYDCPIDKILRRGWKQVSNLSEAWNLVQKVMIETEKFYAEAVYENLLPYVEALEKLEAKRQKWVR